MNNTAIHSHSIQFTKHSILYFQNLIETERVKYRIYEFRGIDPFHDVDLLLFSGVVWEQKCILFKVTTPYASKLVESIL